VFVLIKGSQEYGVSLALANSFLAMLVGHACIRLVSLQLLFLVAHPSTFVVQGLVLAL